MTDLSNCLTSAQWNKVGIRHHHGIVVPLFSLHSAQSAGIGEYSDLLPLIDWCAKIGYDVIQLLPLNDPGPDSSPYSALSAFALNPIHLGLAQLPNLHDYPNLEQALKQLQTLNTTSKVEYAKVRELKDSFLKQYYAWEFPSIAHSSEYLAFLHDNPWLRSYSLFKVLKNQHLWTPWEEWPEELRNPTQETIEALHKRFIFECQYHQFVQYLCFKQMSAVKERAHQAHIFIKGDIPILISRESADLWEHRELFLPEYSAGAPPDVYSSEGQKWGFPIYNWDALEAQQYKWWRNRLTVASRLYDLYRLDHIVGFFRIWAIPADKNAMEGHFIPSDERTWIDHGVKILRVMAGSSPMLPIGEDLGTIPLAVRPCLRELGICGTKVMRWERYWDTTREFIPIDQYYLESMTTVSTHDSTTLAGWWRDSPDEAQLYASTKGWDYDPILNRDQAWQILRDSHHSGSLFHINLIQEYLALFPNFVHPDPTEERVNIPGIVSDSNWSYRMLPTVEQLVTHEPLATAIRQLIS